VNNDLDGWDEILTDDDPDQTNHTDQTEKSPKTVFYKLTKEEIKTFWNEQYPQGLTKKIVPLAREIGFPCFIRTDYASGKHDYINSCYVVKEKDLPSHVYNVIESNLLADFIGLPFKVLFFREFLELEFKFRAFQGKLPIAKERRYFIKDGKIQCHHPYWPVDAIEMPDNENYKTLLKELNQEEEQEIKLLSKYSLKVRDALKIHDYWSIDFACGSNGIWYLIDIAIGENSFHWLDCEFCPNEMRAQYQRYFESRNLIKGSE